MTNNQAELADDALSFDRVDARSLRVTVSEQSAGLSDDPDGPSRIYVENMSEGLATLSSAGVVLFANDRLGELLGCVAFDVVGRQMTDFLVSASQQDLVTATASANIETRLEVGLQRPDGGVVAVLAGISWAEVGNERLARVTFAELTAEHGMRRETRVGQQRFEALYMGAPVPAYTWQVGPLGLVLVDRNEAAGQVTDGTADYPLHTAATTFYADDPGLLADLVRCVRDRVVVERAMASSGSSLTSPRAGHEQHLHVTMVPVPPDLVVVHTQDVTERWVAERELRTSEERYRTIVENAQEGISIVDEHGIFTFANRRTAELLGYEASELTGMEATVLTGIPFGSAGSADVSSTPSTQYEVTAIRPDGTTIELLVSTAPILQADTGDAGSLCMIADISGLRHAEQELAYWGMHDPLTGLPNRILLTDRIDQALARDRRHAGMVAALFCDLDGFKEVNDSYGHHVGDEVLKAVADRLRGAVRPDDTVSRLGGDEFVCLCESVFDESGALGVASRVLEAVSRPMEIAGHVLELSVSVGIAFATGEDAAELLRNADAAMYLAKQRGCNRAELFDEHLRQLAAQRLGMIADLRHAGERGELRLHYQPVFSLDGELLLGVEALVRWQHPENGLLYPDTFVPAAESANLIGDIGSWVLRNACRQASTWVHRNGAGEPLHMAVNVSARQLAQGSGFVQLVADALADSGIDPGALVLEVTESAVMDDAEATLSILRQLKRLGVRLAIDDFGTGYSSLVYLKRFPVDQLKVDRSFVAGLGTDPDDSAIVASVVSLARAVGVVAIAEGVETREQLAALQKLGCELGQGYLWSRGLPASDIDIVLGRGGFPTQPLEAISRDGGLR